MKKIWIYFSREEKMWYPFDQRNYLEAYFYLIKDIEENHNIEVYIVRWKSYIWNWEFSNSYRFDYNKNDIELYETWKVKVDLIFNRDNENTIPYIDDCKIINHPDFDNLCTDKLKTYEKFSELCPKTTYINSYEEFLESSKILWFEESDLIVLKKNFLTNWIWVYIWELKWVKKNTYIDWDNILFQEFIDSSIWIPWIVDWFHDIRVTVVNWKITNSFIRQPKKWSYLANTSQWGSIFVVDLWNIPKDLIVKVEKITKTLVEYSPLFFSVDFMNSKDWFKLVELNSRPWLDHPSEYKEYYIFNNAVRDMLVEAVK